MFSNEITDQITGRLSAHFDGIPRATLRSVVRETLVARETLHADHARMDAAEDDTKAKGQAVRDRGQARRDAAADALKDMWKKGAKA